MFKRKCRLLKQLLPAVPLLDRRRFGVSRRRLNGSRKRYIYWSTADVSLETLLYFTATITTVPSSKKVCPGAAYGAWRVILMQDLFLTKWMTCCPSFGW